MAHLILQLPAVIIGALLAAFAGSSYVNKFPDSYRDNLGLLCLLFEWFGVFLLAPAWYGDPVFGFGLLMLWTAVSASLAQHWVNLRIRDNGRCSLKEIAKGGFWMIGVISISEALFLGGLLLSNSHGQQPIEMPDPIAGLLTLWLLFMPLAFVIAQAVSWSPTRSNRVKA
jgi:hypothetical protein